MVWAEMRLDRGGWDKRACCGPGGCQASGGGTREGGEELDKKLCSWLDVHKRREKEQKGKGKPRFLGEKDKGWKSVCSCLSVHVQLFVYVCSVCLSLCACVHMSLHACLSICMGTFVHTYVIVRYMHTCAHTGTGMISFWTYRVWWTDSHKPAFQRE